MSRLPGGRGDRNWWSYLVGDLRWIVFYGAKPFDFAVLRFVLDRRKNEEQVVLMSDVVAVDFAVVGYSKWDWSETEG